jgi:transcriptional regulator of heat shock response
MEYMQITERQKLILDKLVEEYISSAQPVSSQTLEGKYSFGFSPATIRSEMYRLTEAGYLSQPHTSAGRVPSDKGYRFYVNNLLQERKIKEKPSVKELSEKESLLAEDEIKLLQSITRDLADSSSALAFTFNDNVFWKDGWNRVFKEPEFKEADLLETFTDFLEDFEKDIQDFELGPDLKVFIGKENPFNKVKDFSIIISQCSFPKKEKGYLGIVGPKRMAYEKSIDSINNLKEILKSL